MDLTTDIYFGNAIEIPATDKFQSVQIFSADGYEVKHFPVNVVNVKGKVLGLASNKDEYINIWNADYDNNQVAFLNGGYGPFEFLAHIKKSKSLANPAGNPDTELIDSDGLAVADFNNGQNETILYE